MISVADKWTEIKDMQGFWDYGLQGKLSWYIDNIFQTLERCQWDSKNNRASVIGAEDI